MRRAVLTLGGTAAGLAALFSFKTHAAVSDAEVDQYLATLKSQNGNEAEYRLSHILVLVPEQSTDALVVHHPQAKYFDA